MLKLQHLTAGYGEKTILHDISLDFPPGTVTAILGPNGCGKSTLLKAAAGLLAPVSGQVLSEEPRARHIAYLPQSRRVPEMCSGPDSTQGLRPWHRWERNSDRPSSNSYGDWRVPWLGWPRRYRQEDEAIARAAMARLGVLEFADRPLPELSGGTRQKCYLAMALAQEADTLLLDEPTSFLDIGHQLRLMGLCRELAAEGRAVTVVLHALPLALGYADRIALLEGGRLLALGTPGEILDSGILDRVFGVRVLSLDTDAGRQYVCVAAKSEACRGGS